MRAWLHLWLQLRQLMGMKMKMNEKGFSLMELIVVMAILAVGLSIAVPGLMAMGRSNAIKADARSLKNLLAKTRMDAVRRNQSLTVAINTEADSCIVSVTGGATVSTTIFNGVQCATSPASLAMVWDNKGITSNFSRIDLFGAEATYSLFVSSAGNIRIAK